LSDLPPANDLDALLQRVAAGERAAFDAFYSATVDRCMALARSVLGNHAWAEDCVADSYVAAWRQAASFDPGRASAMAWLSMICRTRAIDRLRRERTQVGYSLRLRPLDDEAEQGLDPASVFGGFLAFGKLERALHRLSGEQRRLLELTYFQGLSNSEIATATGLPLGTVKSCIRRGVALLRKELLDDERDLDTV
jgi:RNA polymerase sigma-70 factor, ECF subfamily